MTHTLILSANPGKKVLFWDEEESLRIVAPEIHIVQDAETKNNRSKGSAMYSLHLQTKKAVY